MQEKLNQFAINQVWVLVHAPYGKTIIGSKWVFKNKKDEIRIVMKNKARLVAQGYNQQEGIYYDETFALVATLEAIRIFLAFVTYMNFIVYQIDVKSAFLNEKLKEEIYVKQPLGFESSEFPNHFCKLGVLTYFLRFQIKQSKRGISINQEKYVKDLLKKYDIDGSSVKTLMKKHLRCLPVAWRQTCVMECKKRQQSVAMSLAKAEYVAAAGCCANILWMKSQLTDYDIICEKVPIFCDNTSAIAISNNPVLHSRTKHIDIRYHFIRDHILKGDIELHFIPTQYQLADIFIKPLDEPTFKRLICELELIPKEEPNTSQDIPKSPNPFLHALQVEFNFDEITFNTNNEVSPLYPGHPQSKYFKLVSDFMETDIHKRTKNKAKNDKTGHGME
ncbi:retrovirus-related pol polyprotein from transposon TNT 1-94 [Tanacetum coccineum]